MIHNQKWTIVLGCALALFTGAAANAQCLQTVAASNGSPLHYFGSGVAIDGDFAVIGAQGWGSNHQDTGWGTAYVYRRVGTQWTLEAQLFPSNTAAYQKFGISVAINGNYIVVGAVEDNMPGGGAAFVFKRNSNGQWLQTTKLRGADTAANDWFGQSVSIDGDRVVVGAFRSEETQSKNETGSAYVFRRLAPSDLWVQEAKLLASDLMDGDWFGYSVSLNGDTVLVGAPKDKPTGSGAGGSLYGVGSAYVFVREGETWMEQAKLTSDYPFPPDLYSGPLFGWSVSLQGDRALIGAWGDDGRKGAAYVFQRSNGTWTQSARLIADDRTWDDGMGTGVALSGDTAVVGVRFRDTLTGIPDAGSLCVFKKYDSGWLQTHELRSNVPSAEAYLGFSAALSGDFALGGAVRGNGVAAITGNVLIHAVAGPHCPGDNYWLLAQSGTLNDPGNWFPKVPGPLNAANYSVDGTYTVSLTSDAENKSILVSDGDVSFDLAGNTYRTNTFIGPSLITSAAPNAPAASLTIGNAAGGALRTYSGMVGYGIDSAGEITVTGSNTLWAMQGDMSVGLQGHGTLNIINGANVICGNSDVGKFAGSSGNVLIDNASWAVDFLVTVGNLSTVPGTASQIVLQNGGTLSSGIVGFFGGIFIYPNGSVIGDGVANATAINFGHLSPGNPVGLLTINGNYAQVGQLPNQGNRSGQLTIDMTGTIPELEYDVLDIDGQARLGGGLFVNVPSEAKLPTDGEPLPFLHATNISPLNPRFDVAFLSPLPGKFMRVVYPGGFGSGGSVSIQVLALDTLLNINSVNPQPIPGTPTSACVADFNGDEIEDVAITITNGEIADGDLIIFFGVANGNPQIGAQQYSVGPHPMQIIADKFDDNTSYDLATICRGNGLPGSGVLTLRYNDGLGGFISGVNISAGLGADPRHIAPGNLIAGPPGAGTDLVVGNFASNSLTILVNNGNGGMTAAGSINLPTPPLGVGTGDLDNDKDLDIVVAGPGGIHVHMNNGGAFPATTLALNELPLELTLADFNSDGAPEIVTGNALHPGANDGTVSVFLNNGDGTFTPPVTLPVPGGEAFSMVVANLDQHQSDLDLDLALLVRTAGDERAIRVLRNDSTPLETVALTLLDENTVPPPPAGAVKIVAGDLDENGTVDLITINESAPGRGAGRGSDGPSMQVLRNGDEEPPPPPPCPADIFPPGGNGVVNVSDLLAVINAWGPCPQPCPPGCAADIVQNCAVNVSDLLAVINAWGACPQ